MRNERAALARDAGVLGGFLELEGRAHPVTVRYASRLSLYVAFETEEAFADRTVFSKLRLTLSAGEPEVELSGARLHIEYTRQGAAGRLVFLEDIYDCHALMFEKKFVNLRGFFQNVPIVLSQKDTIRPEFRDYVAASLFDLAVYKRFFNEQDRILANEPPEVAAPAQEALLRTEGRRFLEFFDAQLVQLDTLVSTFTSEEHERHGYYLRRQAWEFILGSEFLKRTNLKPRGYAGDAEMMVMTYENAWVGNYVFNKLMHKHPVETPAAQAVRNRRRLIARELHGLRERADAAGGPPLRAMSIACGPAWELNDIFECEEDARSIHLTLLDQDPQALEMALQAARGVEATRDLKLKLTFLNDSVRTMLRGQNLPERFGHYDFIYSMGLFDYLTRPVARALLERLYELLSPGGHLLIGNYHVDNPTRHYMAYWMDWVLYYRSEGDFLELASRLPGARTSVTFDETRAQMFLRVDKEG